MNKILGASIGLVLSLTLWGGCKAFELAKTAPAVALPATSESVTLTPRFQGKAPAPGDKTLQVCGWAGEPGNYEYWCLDYYLFQQALAAEAQQKEIKL